MSAVELSRVRLERSGVTILDQVDVTVERGERMAVLGPSGSGKTSLLRVIAGLEGAYAGDARVWGETVGGPRPDVVMVFQTTSVYEHLDVERNLAFPLDVTDAEGDVEETGRRFSISGLFSRRAHTLSAGQRGLVGAARAVVRSDVTLVLLDEVLVAADPGRRQRIVDSVMNDSSITVVFASNDPVDVFRYADRVAVLHGGRIRQVDEPQVVYRRPASLSIAGLMGEINRFPGTVRVDDGVWAEVGASRLRLAPRFEELSHGRRVVMAVRPHDLRPASPSTPFEHVLHGTVGRAEPFGAGTRILFGIGDTPGVAFVGEVADGARWSETGHRCRWHVPPERVLLFDPTDGSLV